MLKINEIYFSLQGESSWSGIPCVFIRFTGCHLRCSWCDSEFSFYEGDKMSLEQILDKVIELAPHCKLIEITGGEPLLQKDCGKLVDLLLNKDFTVLLETSGSLDINLVSDKVHRIVDMKCPDSLMENKNDYTNLKRLTVGDELKFVVDSREDFLWVEKLIEQYNLHKRAIPLIVSSTGNIPLEELAELIKASYYSLRMQVQLHKIIWDKNQREV